MAMPWLQPHRPPLQLQPPRWLPPPLRPPSQLTCFSTEREVRSHIRVVEAFNSKPENMKFGWCLLGFAGLGKAKESVEN